MNLHQLSVPNSNDGEDESANELHDGRRGRSGKNFTTVKFEYFIQFGEEESLQSLIDST